MDKKARTRIQNFFILQLQLEKGKIESLVFEMILEPGMKVEMK